MEYYLGIEIGGTKFQAVIGNSNAEIIDRYRTIVERSLGGEGIRNEIRKVISHFEDYNPKSIGIGFGGPIDYESGIIQTSHQIAGWDKFPISSWLRELSGLPVCVDNDANVAALAESLKGAGKDTRRVFYVTLGSGMGGGMIIDGKIYHGEKPGESEIGMLPFDRNMNVMESHCSGWGVDKKIREYSAAHPDSILANLTKDITSGESKYLVQAINSEDAGAKKILYETADNIAYALSFVTLLFHPKIIIIGGGLSLIGKYLFDEINSLLPKYVVKSFHPVPQVKVAKLGEDVVCIGALLLAIQNNN